MSAQKILWRVSTKDSPAHDACFFRGVQAKKITHTFVLPSTVEVSHVVNWVGNSTNNKNLITYVNDYFKKIRAR